MCFGEGGGGGGDSVRSSQNECNCTALTKM